MSLPIISADERLKETRGIKGVIFGKSGIGKTYPTYQDIDLKEKKT